MPKPTSVCRACTILSGQYRARPISNTFILIRPSRQSSTAPTKPPPETNDEQNALSRRLEEATEETLLTGGRAGRRAIEEAGFSEELKTRLLNKIGDAKFRAEHGRAISEAGLDPGSMAPSATGAAALDLASSKPWEDAETTGDAVLRMLHDARKPLPPGSRGKPKIPDPVVVDMRLRRTSPQSAGQRAAAARDKATAYAALDKDKNKPLNDSEREAMRQEFRDRFAPGARAMPNSISGLAALANERIEDAIARGQFRNIPRGTSVARDTRADNPFIDTTEYIMNKMIQRQDIVPPWIEKQQELVRAVRVFRVRLRNDWRRHAARLIASRGGSLQEQMARAQAYARAEQVHNPRRRNVEQMSLPTSATDDPVMTKAGRPLAAASALLEKNVAADAGGNEPAATAPFRDSQWEASERSYVELAIRNLNAMTRSYNLMAPELAKKPCFSFDREMSACFADVAPELANSIRDRAVRPQKPASDIDEKLGRRMLNQLTGEGGAGAGAARVHDSKTPNYGLREMWKDLWKK